MILPLLLALSAAPAWAKDDDAKARPARRPSTTHVARPAPKSAPAERHRPPPERHAPTAHRPHVDDPPRHVAPHHSPDHRFARPPPWRLPPLAGHRPPPYSWYRPWFTHWWIHPYFRWLHATVVVVRWDFACTPWAYDWTPPPRAGWAWVPGHWEGPIWVPGHWEPVAAAPAGYVYEAGFWVGDVYVQGFWRLASRPGWVWIDARVLADHTVIQGHWRPNVAERPGWVWEPGFWDGEVWVEGFWRPRSRPGEVWVSATWDANGIYHCGYWEPVEARPTSVWIPGWFDGEQWVGGYWVSEDEYRGADPGRWTPPDGWNADPGNAPTAEPEGPALAMPAE